MARVAVGTSSDSIRNADRVLCRHSDGTPYVAVTQSSANIEMWKGNSTTVPTAFAEQYSITTTFPATGVAVAIDANDDIHCVWGQDNGKNSVYRYAVYDCGTDSFGTPEDIFTLSADPLTLNNMWVSIAVDTSNIPHVACADYDSNMGTDYATVVYTNRIGGSWKATVEVEGAAATKICYRQSIAFNGSNVPYIGYVNESDTTITEAAGNQNNATTFTLTDRDATVDSGPVSLAYTSGGTIEFAYRDSDATAALYDGATARDTGSDAVNSGDSRINVACDGTDIYLFYIEGSANRYIAYDRWTGSAWDGETIFENSAAYDRISLKWAQNNDNSQGTYLDVVFEDIGIGVYWDTLTISTATSGTGAQIVPTPTQTAIGVEQPEGNGSQTAPTPTQAASGLHVYTIPGSATSSIPIPTQGALALEAIPGAATSTISTPSQASAGFLEILSSGIQTTPTPTQTATGAHTLTVTSDGSQTAPTPTQAAAGVLETPGSGAQTTPTPVQTAAGEHTQETQGAGTQTAPTPTQAASGAEEIPGAGLQTAPTPSQAAVGIAGAVGDGAQTAPTPSQVAVGIAGAVGAGTQTAPTPTQAASGLHTQTATGAGSQTSPTPTQEAVGIAGVVGDGIQTAPTPSQAATGLHTQIATGDGAQAIPTPTQVAIGTETITGAATGTSPVPTQAAVGLEEIPGTGAQTVSLPTQVASAIVTILGAGTQTAPTPTQSAFGVEQPEGAGAQTTPTPAQAALSSIVVPGAGEQIVPVPTQTAAATSIEAVYLPPDVTLTGAPAEADIIGDPWNSTVTGEPTSAVSIS